jgi:hypothetical protein
MVDDMDGLLKIEGMIKAKEIECNLMERKNSSLKSAFKQRETD